jgi:hypothetical protein
MILVTGGKTAFSLQTNGQQFSTWLCTNKTSNKDSLVEDSSRDNYDVHMASEVSSAHAAGLGTV